MSDPGNEYIGNVFAVWDYEDGEQVSPSENTLESLSEECLEDQEFLGAINNVADHLAQLSETE